MACDIKKGLMKIEDCPRRHSLFFFLFLLHLLSRPCPLYIVYVYNTPGWMLQQEHYCYIAHFSFRIVRGVAAIYSLRLIRAAPVYKKKSAAINGPSRDTSSPAAYHRRASEYLHTDSTYMCVLSVYCHDDIIGICLSFPFFFYFLFSPFNSPGEIYMNEVERA